jgi:RNA polymerase sigma-70 factor (ECF subfamily)
MGEPGRHRSPARKEPDVEPEIAQQSTPSNEAVPARPTDLHALPDEALIALLKTGDRDAMTPLFRRYRRLLLSIASKILRDGAEAEELVQEIFFEFYTKIERFDPTRSSTKTWLMKLSYSRSLDRLKILSHRHHYNRGEMPKQIPDRSQLQNEADDVDGLTFEERSQIIQTALGKLPEIQRRTVEMACFRGLPLREIAGQINESYQNARNHYYRGLKKLRSHVDEIRAERINGARNDRRNAVG